MNQSDYEVYLPRLVDSNRTSFFDLNRTSNLVVEILCSNESLVAHKRTIDLKICRKALKIKDLLVFDSKTKTYDAKDKFEIKFNSPIKTIIAQLVPLDEAKKSLDSYEFRLSEPSNNLDVLFSIVFFSLNLSFIIF